MDAGLAPGRLRALAGHGRADLGARSTIPKIDYQDIYYYAAPKQKAPKSLDEVDPEILETYEKLGIPLSEQEVLAGAASEGAPRDAVDAVFDSVSVVTTFKKELARSA